MFIFNQVRYYDPLIVGELLNSVFVNPAKLEFLCGQANINIPLIRDWFMAYSLIFSFDNYQYKDVKPLYDDYVANGTTQTYIDTVKALYKRTSKLQLGMPAPHFTLKNTDGKSISLSDFKGKVVYIDFWGVFCGPCISDIENAAKVHEKYKNKDVAFINICVDESGNVWKNKLKELKLDGINLVAEGWVKNPVCKDYNINGIPHYVLIDRQGNIVEKNANILGQLTTNYENMLDKALGK